MRRNVTRILSVFLTMAMLFSLASITGNAQTTVGQTELPSMSGQTDVLAAGKAAGEINADISANQLLGDFHAASPEEKPTSDNKELASAKEKLRQLVHDSGQPDKSGKEVESVGALPTQSHMIFGTNITVTMQGNFIEFNGSGVLTRNLLDESWLPEIHNLTIRGHVSIGDGVFNKLPNLRAVAIENDINVIGAYAFANCPNLSAISIPYHVNIISEGAFIGCTSLHQVTIHSPVANIGSVAFAGCPLTTLFIPHGLSAIGYGAFSGCQLPMISVPANLTAIDDYAFSGCTELESVDFPSSLQTIGTGAFMNCTSLKNVSMPSAEKFGVSVFEQCMALESFDMPPNLTETGGSTFNGCEKLRSVIFSDKLEKIGDRDFFECFALEEAKLPVSLGYIGEAAFFRCSSLKKIIFPDNYVTVNNYAFSYCNAVEPIESVVKLGSIGNEAFINTHFLTQIAFSLEAYLIGKSALQNNDHLRSVSFGGGKMNVLDYALYGCSNLTELTNLPELSHVGTAAFHHCAVITAVKLSDDCQNVGDGAFYQCENLTEVDFNNAPAKVGHHAFALCDKLQSITNCTGVSALESFAFGSCTSLQDASGFTGVTTLGEGVFFGCTALTEASFGDALTVIPDRVFAKCQNLTAFAFPSTLESIGMYTFAQSGLSGDITLPEKVTMLDVGAFSKCENIRKIILPDNLSAVGDMAFLSCNSLREVSGSGVKETGYGAFGFCPALETVGFGAVFEKAGDFCFAGCEKLSSIGDNTALVRVGGNAFADCTSLRSLHTNKLSYIGERAFYNSGLEQLILTADIEKLGDFAFETCKNLRSVEMTGKLSEIGTESFALCTALQTVTLPDNLETIGNLAFYGCTNLRDTVIPQKVSTIGNAAFYQCSSLTEVTMPDSVRKIGYSCFKECTSLKNVRLSDNITAIETGTFYGCSALIALRIPQGVSSIGFGACADCRALTELTLPESLLEIGKYAFNDCKQLDSVALPASLKTIGDCAFACCDALSEITLPTGVSAVNDYAFYECPSLQTVRMRGEVIGIGVAAFYHCGALRDIYFGSGVPLYISSFAFDGVSSALVLHYNPHAEGWTTPQWTAPDKAVYTTEPISVDVSGSYEGLEWEYLSDSGSLLFRGTGQAVIDRSEDAGWTAFLNEVVVVKIESGVIAVNDRAFTGCKALRRVTVGEDVRRIGAYAFSECSNLVYAKLPVSLSEIGEFAFYGCSALNTELPCGLNSIGDYVFYGCSSMNTISIPESVQDIGEGAFYNCSGVTKTILPQSLTELKDYTFRGCTALESVVIPERTIKIGRYALANCDNLTTVTICGVPAIADYAFAHSKKLSLLRFLKSQPGTVGYDAFFGLPDDCKAAYISSWGESLTASDGRSIPTEQMSPETGQIIGGLNWFFYPESGMLMISGSGALNEAPWKEHTAEITTVIIGDGVTAIGDNVFAGCNGLQKAVIGKNVASVGKNAFADCTALREITLPENVTSLGEGVFSGCTDLSYASLPETLTTIPDYAFCGCESLQTAPVGDHINHIGYSAFYNCGLLEQIQLTANAVSVDGWAFARCGNLRVVDGAEKITNLGEAAFFGCESLDSFALSGQLTAIPAYAFAGTALTVLSVPSLVKTIGEKAFWGSKLEQIDLGNVRTIGEKTFFESGLLSAEISPATESIGAMAFAGCRSLQQIKVSAPNTAYMSADGVLYSKNGDTLLQYPAGKDKAELTVSDSVSHIGAGAFFGSTLTEVVLPETVTEIPESAFARSAELEKVYLGSGVDTIGANAFRECGKLSKAYMEGSAPTQIGENAFTDVANGFTFIFTRSAQFWTDGSWQAPDGKTYQTQKANTDKFHYQIRLEWNGGDETDFASSYLYGTEISLPENVTYEGKTFGGWYDNPGFSGEPVTVIAADETGDKHFYAYWIDANSEPSLVAGEQKRVNDTIEISYTAFTGADNNDILIFAAAYNDKKMIASDVITIESPGSIIQDKLIVSGGSVTRNTLFKIMLLDAETKAPLAENLSIWSDFILNGSQPCKLALASAPDGQEIMGRELDDDLSGAAPNELEATIRISDADLSRMITAADKGSAGSFDLSLTASFNGEEAAEVLTSKTDTTAIDRQLGYVPGAGKQNAAHASEAWLFPTYRSSSKSRVLANRQDDALTGVYANTEGGKLTFEKKGNELLSLVSTGYIGIPEEKLVKVGTQDYRLILPYYGMSLALDLDTEQLLGAITGWATDDSAASPESAVISLLVDDKTYFKLRFTTDNTSGEITSADVLAFNVIGRPVTDSSYNPIAIDHSVAPNEEMPLEVNSISPDKGSNGKVTLKILGAMTEASAKPSLYNGTDMIEAEKVYWFSHDKLYATFDLTAAADGIYSLQLEQKGKTVSLENCFTLDSSLPKGELKSEINVDKTAEPGKEYNGSITFVNTGYTDVYAPVVYIDTGNMELRENEYSQPFAYQSVFVPNGDGLAGIVANGETAAFNFLYKLKSAQGFVFNLYNYAEVDCELEAPYQLTADSAPGTYLKANMQALTGRRSGEFAESIAKMACRLHSYGDDIFTLDYLNNAYLADAQGTLIGDSLVNTVDIVSRDLSFSRYYTTNVSNRQKKGLFGKGWFSDLDVTATYQTEEEDGVESVSVNTPFGVTFYLKEDGVFKECIYGQSIAEVTDGKIILRETDGSYSEFNEKGQPMRSGDIYGNYTEVVYNDSGKPAELKNNIGDSLVFEYTDGNLTGIHSSVTNDRVDYSYNDSKRLTNVNGMYAAVSFEYECEGGINNGALKEVVSDKGIRQTVLYDECGRITEVADNDTFVKYSYPGENIVRMTDDTENMLEIGFNAAGSVVRAVDSDGATSEVELGEHLLSTGAKNGLFSTGSISYDDRYNVSKITGRDNVSVSFTYDDLGNIASISDRGGKKTEYKRNEKGETTEIIYPDGETEKFTYDDKGNMLTQTMRDGKTVRMSYNDIYQLVKEEYSTGDMMEYLYDSHGNRTGIIKNGLLTEMKYDSTDKLISVKHPFGKTVDYAYDTAGNLVSENVNDGFTTAYYSYDYDKYGRLVRVWLSDVLVTEYRYNKDGTLAGETTRSGTTTDYTYKDGLLSAIYHRLKDGSTLSFFEYTYDSAGNIASVRDKTGTWTYGYDALGQLTKAVAPNGETTLYEYDLSGNRTAVTTGGTTVSYNANAMNQYTTVGNTVLSYDKNGNLVSATDGSGTTTYEYDFLDRLVNVKEANGRMTRYSYDAFGLRNGRSVTVPGKEEVVTAYVNSPLGEGYALAETTGAVHSYLIQGNGLAGRLNYDEQNHSFKLYNYAYNHLGSTTDITFDDGTPVNAYTYNQEGKVISANEGIANDYTYVGKYGITDDKNGLYFDRARFIAQRSMSFMNPDPIGQSSDLNLYRYANNNGICNIDISGCSVNRIVGGGFFPNGSNNSGIGNKKPSESSIFEEANKVNKVKEIESIKPLGTPTEKPVNQQAIINELKNFLRNTKNSNAVKMIAKGAQKAGKFIKAFIKSPAGKKLILVGLTAVAIGTAGVVPAGAATVAGVVTTINVAMNVSTAYDIGKFAYDNRHAIKKGYETLKGKTGEAAEELQRLIEKRDSLCCTENTYTDKERTNYNVCLVVTAKVNDGSSGGDVWSSSETSYWSNTTQDWHKATQEEINRVYISGQKNTFSPNQIYKDYQLPTNTFYYTDTISSGNYKIAGYFPEKNLAFMAQGMQNHLNSTQTPIGFVEFSVTPNINSPGITIAPAGLGNIPGGLSNVNVWRGF